MLKKNYFKLLLDISFFPQLIAGPIVRYKDIQQQIDKRNFTLDNIFKGLVRFCVGLSKKVLIANTMANVVDTIYMSSLENMNIGLAWIFALCYLLQIYFDFSGYSDMAIGIARVFGFRFRENFSYPYKSTTIKEFWRRWHISLSSWFKEYLYIPLGGNRKGRFRTSVNKSKVFGCCGLWHGANWTFLLWGLLHGLFLIREDFIPIKKLPRILSWFYTILVITLLLVVFRCESLDSAISILTNMFCGFNISDAELSQTIIYISPINITTFVVGFIASTGYIYKLYENVKAYTKAKDKLQILYMAQGIGALILLILSILSLANGGYNPFIYFRF